MKPSLDSLPITWEDCEVFELIGQRLDWRYGLHRGAIELRHNYYVADRRDGLIMLGRGVSIAKATMGSAPYWRPAKYWVAPDGTLNLVGGWMDTHDIP